MRRHATLTGDMAALAIESGRRRRAADPRPRRRQGRRHVDRAKLDQANVVADAAKSTHAASLAALTERRRSRADIDERTAAIAGLQAASDEAADDTRHRR